MRLRHASEWSTSVMVCRRLSTGSKRISCRFTSARRRTARGAPTLHVAVKMRYKMIMEPQFSMPSHLRHRVDRLWQIAVEDPEEPLSDLASAYRGQAVEAGSRLTLRANVIV